MEIKETKPKLTFKDWALMAVAALLVISVVSNYIQYHYTSTATSDNIAKDSLIKSGITDLKRHTDTVGSGHVVFSTNANTIKQDLAQYSRTLDTVANRIGEKKNAIVDYTKVQTTISDKNLRATLSTDSTKRRFATYKDKAFDARYTFPFGVDSTGTFDLSANVDLITANYTKRAWFLASLKSYTDIYSPDKRVKIRGVERLVIEQPAPTFGLRLRATASFNTYSSGFSAGPEAAFDFGRNQVRFNYFYDVQSGHWIPVISLSHDFLRF